MDHCQSVFAPVSGNNVLFCYPLAVPKVELYHTSIYAGMPAPSALTAFLLQEIDANVRKMVDGAAEKAKTDPELPLEELYTNIYVQPPSDMKVRGCDPTIWAATR